MTDQLNDEQRFEYAIELAARLVKQMNDDPLKAIVFAFDYWQVPTSMQSKAREALNEALK